AELPRRLYQGSRSLHSRYPSRLRRTVLFQQPVADFIGNVFFVRLAFESKLSTQSYKKSRAQQRQAAKKLR
ncbi:MAG: hypothetical protein IJ823_03730, partial [Bacteroidales bacterium]|nr:hypothetical protein [Bacteroidales bacterium]